MADLPEKVREDLRQLADEYQVKRIVLFGSRARGDNQPKSDIDLAVYGCRNFSSFALDVDEKVWTLLMFDIIDMDRPGVSKDLIQEINRDGVVIYEAL